MALRRHPATSPLAMINTSGNKTVLVDSDALIGLINENDLLHRRCLKISNFLTQYGFSTIVPYPIVLESATTLARAQKVNRPDLAHRLLKDYAASRQPSLKQDNVAKLVAKLYKPQASKKNTPFDFYILALAKKNNIKLVFSFDAFYQKRGLTLIEEIID